MVVSLYPDFEGSGIERKRRGIITSKRCIIGVWEKQSEPVELQMLAEKVDEPPVH